ncbi:MAG: putative phosphate transport protein (TIGR00153 family) [Gammaproteobacteria bacterium]|jgi:predicted phosphate transport protein (TIGR00153 family)
MRNVMKIFGRSPFIPLQMHMEKVVVCVDKIPEILEIYRTGDSVAVEKLSKKLSKLEHEADIIKDDIRGNLPRGLFMPVDRSHILSILEVQDRIANKSENIGVLLTFKQANSSEEFDTVFDNFFATCLATFYATRDVIERLDELVETGFGGPEANNVHKLIDTVAKKEHEADVCQREAIRTLLKLENEISYGDFFLWTSVLRQLGGIADDSEHLAESVRNILESK